jgi:protein-S-isoprenylcysteine O-methyltransferase Ste14
MWQTKRAEVSSSKPASAFQTNMKRRIISIPPVYFLACVVVTGLVRLLAPGLSWIPFPFNLCGLLFLGVAIYFIGSAHHSLKRHATPVTYAPSTCVIEDGLYRYSRNPMYVGFVTFLIGLSVLSGNIFAFLSPVLMFCVLNWMFIPYEEEKMENTFGTEFLEYEQKVRRWL